MPQRTNIFKKDNQYVRIITTKEPTISKKIQQWYYLSLKTTRGHIKLLNQEVSILATEVETRNNQNAHHRQAIAIREKKAKGNCNKKDRSEEGNMV